MAGGVLGVIAYGPAAARLGRRPAAASMVRRGAGPQAVLEKTGYQKGVYGYGVETRGDAFFKPSATFGARPAGTLAEMADVHPDVERAYPGIGSSLRVEVVPDRLWAYRVAAARRGEVVAWSRSGETTDGFYDHGNNLIAVRAQMPGESLGGYLDRADGTLVHELQHYAQRQDGLRAPRRFLDAADRHEDGLEVEARNSAVRRKLTPEERVEMPREMTQDVKPRDVRQAFGAGQPRTPEELELSTLPSDRELAKELTSPERLRRRAAIMAAFQSNGDPAEYARLMRRQGYPLAGEPTAEEALRRERERERLVLPGREPSFMRDATGLLPWTGARNAVRGLTHGLAGLGSAVLDAADLAVTRDPLYNYVQEPLGKWLLGANAERLHPRWGLMRKTSAMGGDDTTVFRQWSDRIREGVARDPIEPGAGAGLAELTEGVVKYGLATWFTGGAGAWAPRAAIATLGGLDTRQAYRAALMSQGVPESEAMAEADKHGAIAGAVFSALPVYDKLGAKLVKVPVGTPAPLAAAARSVPALYTMGVAGTVADQLPAFNDASSEDEAQALLRDMVGSAHEAGMDTVTSLAPLNLMGPGWHRRYGQGVRFGAAGIPRPQPRKLAELPVHDDKGGESPHATFRNFLATDDVPDTLFGFPVVQREEDYTESDIKFFKENPKAAGFYDTGEEDEIEEDVPQQAAAAGTTRGAYPGSLNNPGNVEKRTQRRLGEVDSPHERFAKFDTPVHGLLQAADVIRQIATVKLAEQGKPFTIRNFAEIYAPRKNKRGETENDTDKYIADISADSGFDPDVELHRFDTEDMAKLLRSVVRFESGYPHSQWFTDDEYNLAAKVLQKGAVD